jgi:hypothetical protein
MGQVERLSSKRGALQFAGAMIIPTTKEGELRFVNGGWILSRTSFLIWGKGRKDILLTEWTTMGITHQKIAAGQTE